MVYPLLSFHLVLAQVRGEKVPDSWIMHTGSFISSVNFSLFQIQYHSAGIFQVCLPQIRKTCHGGAVDDTMVNRKRAAHDRGDGGGTVLDDDPLLPRANGQDGPVRWVDDGRKFPNAEHPEIGDRECPALEFLEFQLARLGAAAEILHFVGNRGDTLEIGTLHDRRDQAASRTRSTATRWQAGRRQ